MNSLNRNAESRFALNPTSLDISRSRFDRSSTVKTSFNVGELVPFFIDEVLPGDTFDISTAKVVRMQPMVTPPMDDLFLDTYYFFVPNRLVWDHWRELMGENNQSAWIPSVEYSVPQCVAPSGSGWQVGTIADYLGVPIGVSGFSVSALPFRAYTKIVNDWFRDENIMQPLVLNTGDSNVTGVNSDGLNACERGGKPFIAAKYHDYFTSCLPSPQKGEPVSLSAETFELPVYALNKRISGANIASNTTTNMFFYDGQAKINPDTTDIRYITEKIEPSTGDYNNVVQIDSSSGSNLPPFQTEALTPLNLFAVGNGLSATINELRMAFQLQKLYEKDARGGTRYIEILKTHFGVTSPDARLQRSEYLGGNRIRINVNQIVQQSATSTGTTPQGNPVGLSVTHDNSDSFCQSFTEHGFVIGLMVARYPHTYQQGLERFWSRKNRLDYYFPVFANIGEQAVLNKEICLTGEASDEQAFGYQEAWADYRYKPSRVSGEMRGGIANSLSSWHFADYYIWDVDGIPTLSSSWLQEDKLNVDRVLAVSSVKANQLWADIVIKNKTSRCMPLYSIPGLIDHH